MSLRVIAGEYKGRLLKSPKTDKTRPTSGILRKSVFDICRPWIEGAVFLDVFAGSGAIGIEALSRGASHVTFIDSEKRALLCIQDNLRALKLEEQAQVLLGDALQMLERLEKLKKRFSMIYIDPPYGENNFNLDILTFLDTAQLAQGAHLFIEEPFPSLIEEQKIVFQNLRHIDTRKFGRSLLHQYLRSS